MNIPKQVQEYYGKVLGRTDDLKTNACCTASPVPGNIGEILSLIHPEVAERYFGCGLVAPELLEGKRILDLGCGSGRDCYLLSKLVGPDGFVVGVDMTPEQLAVARRHVSYHTSTFGYSKPNVRFVEGRLETLDRLDLGTEGFDVVISNCVLNLTTDKASVLNQVYHLLRDGGEFYFSDVYADRRVPDTLREDPVLYGECLSGALYWNDFETMAKVSGFPDPLLVESSAIEIGDPQVAQQVGPIRFLSATYRLFKLTALEATLEDYGQSVSYRGTIPHHPEQYLLEAGMTFGRSRPTRVCGNTFRILKESRLADHFEFFEDGAGHRGVFRSRRPSPMELLCGGTPSGKSCC